MTQLEQLQKDYNLAEVKAKEENEQNEKKVFDFLQTLTEKRLIVCLDLTAKNRISIGVYFAIDETTDETDFCSSFSMAYKSKYNFEKHKYEEPELAMDCGSSGLSTRAEEPYKVERWHLMSRIWDHEKEFTDLLKSLDYTKQELADQAYQALEDEKNRIKKEEAAKLEAEVESMIKVGATFNETVYTDIYNYDSHKYEKVIRNKVIYKITKLTPKRAYLEYTKKAIGYYDTVCTGYISLPRLKSHLLNKQIRKIADYTGIADCCSGIAQVSVIGDSHRKTFEEN